METEIQGNPRKRWKPEQIYLEQSAKGEKKNNY